MSEIKLFTDGACRGNPGPGGWGVLLQAMTDAGLRECRWFGGAAETTNNRMELTAVIEGLERLKKPCQVILTTDSKYVKDGYQLWLDKWRRSGWRKASGQKVKNKDLWQALDKVASQHQISWHWVKGHAGHKENEIADQLANQGIDELNRG